MRIFIGLFLFNILVFGDIKIITSNNSSIGTISKEQLIKIYLKEIDTINGVAGHAYR